MLNVKKVQLYLVFLLLATACNSPTTSGPDFKEAVAHHLESVETKDIETFISTLTQSSNLNVIFPSGTILESTDAVIDFHRDWFKDDDWVFKTHIEKIIEGTDQSTALVKYEFQDTADGVPRQAWLILTFQLEDNEWRLIHDQNTRITEKRK